MKLGKSFKIGYIDDDGRFCPLAFAQSCSISMKASSTEVSSPLTGGWEERRPKRNSWSMQHEGLLGSDTATYKYKGKTYGFWALMKKLWLDKYIFTARWKEVLASGAPGDMVQGQCFIDDMKQVASEKSLTKVSVKLNGTGPLIDLSETDLTGAFAYAIHGHTLTLYTVQRPVTGFSVHAGTTAVGAWDDAATGRTQSFTNDAITSSSVITAWKGEGADATEQTGVTFTDCTTLHVVLLQTDERDQMQQLHRYVQPLWWGGLSMGDMTLKRGTDTVAEFATAGLTGIAPRVEINPGTDITLDNYTWTLVTDAPQTIHCTDRTTSLQRTIAVAQTKNNYGAEPYVVMADMQPEPWACAFEVWGNNSGGTRDFTWPSTETPPVTLPVEDLLPDAQHLHWQLTGLGADEAGPYQVQLSLVTDTAQHDVFYAYDATAQKLRIWCPDQVLKTVISASGLNYEGMLFDTDSNGNRVPLTISGVTGIDGLWAVYGDYRFNDVSALTVFNLSNTLTISAWPLDDIVLTGEGGTEVGRIPALSDPSSTYPAWQVITVPGSNIAGAQMEAGAAQSLTYHEYSQSVHVKTSATQTGESTWTINIAIRAGDGSPATLPGNLFVKYGSHSSIAILAGQYGTSASVNYDPSWTIPTATLNHPKAADFNIYTAPTPDVTAGHWTAYKLGLVGGYYCYDIAYLGGTHPELSLTSGNFMFTPTVVKTSEQVADTLYRLTGSSEDNVSVAAKVATAPDWSAANIEHINVNTTDKLHLSYRLRDNSAGVTVTDLTNIIYPDVPEAPYSRKSNIADVLPRLSVICRDQTIYDAKSLEPLKPGKTDVEEFRVQARNGVYASDEVETEARFTDNNDNTISVGTGLTGVVVHAVNHGAELPFA